HRSFMWCCWSADVTSARERRSRMHSRNAGLQRLRSLTRRVGVATAVLTGTFTGFAAAANSGHHRRLTETALPPRRRAAPPVRSNRIPPPPSLPLLVGEQPSGAPSDSQPAQPPSPPAQPPVQTQAP